MGMKALLLPPFTLIHLPRGRTRGCEQRNRVCCLVLARAMVTFTPGRVHTLLYFLEPLGAENALVSFSPYGLKKNTPSPVESGEPLPPFG